MALDLIKQYLIGIGFKVDSNSVKNTEESINQTEEKIKKFNKNSSKGFLETNESMKTLFSLMNLNCKSICKIFPELQGPIKSILSAKKLYEDSIKKIYKKKKIKTNDKSNKNKTKTKDKDAKKTIKDNKDKINNNKENVHFKSPILNKIFKDTIKAKKDLSNFKKNSIKDFKDVKNAAKDLKVEGGKSILGFSFKSIASIAIISVAVISLRSLFKKLCNFLGDLANQDIEYEKLSRQLWTTKENAREIDTALKTLGVTMKDLWLSPTLLKQFNQLRKDAKQLRLPPEFKYNIKVIQDLSFEFKRLKQFGSLVFQWIGNYILKYCAGPLLEIKKGLNKFNNGLLKVIPYIGKIIGSTIGIILRCILLIGKVLSPIFSIISHFIKFIINLINKIPGPIKKIIKIIGIIVGLILAGPVAAIMLIIAALDDLFTFLRGGKSVIGSVFGFFKEKGSEAFDSIKDKFSDLKEKFKEGMNNIKDDWKSYWEKGSEALDKLKDKAKKVWGKIKEYSKGLWDKGKDFITNIGNKVNVFNNEHENRDSIPKTYLSRNQSNTTTTTSNSNNKIENKNTINVFGSDAKSTANEVDKNLTGINIRNIQGVF